MQNYNGIIYFKETNLNVLSIILKVILFRLLLLKLENQNKKDFNPLFML